MATFGILAFDVDWTQPGFRFEPGVDYRKDRLQFEADTIAEVERVVIDWVRARPWIVRWELFEKLPKNDLCLTFGDTGLVPRIHAQLDAAAAAG